jgi:hypothetical protein
VEVLDERRPQRRTVDRHDRGAAPHGRRGPPCRDARDNRCEVASAISKGGMVAIASGSTGGGVTGTSVCRLDSI